MPKLVPRNTFNPRFLACQIEPGIEINERLSRFMVVENEFASRRLQRIEPAFSKGNEENRPGNTVPPAE